MSTLLALSDFAVIRAMERTFSRAVSADMRRHLVEEGIPRHRAYQSVHVAIPEARQTHALHGAFDVLPELVWRWQLPVAAADWSVVLDRYCRDLLATRAEHDLDRLSEALTLLGAGHAA